MARSYDADDRRFMAIDPVKGEIRGPQTLVQYTYVLNNPIKYVDPTGKVWTDIDQQIYLKVRDDFGNIPARKYWESIDKATQDFIDADGNWFFKNQARYAIVDARTQYYFYVFKCKYVDDFDYTQGKKGELIFVGAHGAFGNPAFYHTCIIIFVMKGSSFYNNPRFEDIRDWSWSNVKYATIGADSLEGRDIVGMLRSQPNNKSDMELYKKRVMTLLDVSSTSKTINALFNLEARFKNDTLRYGIATTSIDTVSAREREDRYNSNSFIRGMLREIGIHNVSGITDLNSPGWANPVPPSSF